MSELRKALTNMRENPYNKKILPSKNFSDIFDSSIDSRMNDTRIGTEYLISAKFSSKVVIDQMADPVEQSYAIEDAKNRIIEGVFGEFRELIMEIRHNLNNYDFQEARRVLNKLEHQMFNE